MRQTIPLGVLLLAACTTNGTVGPSADSWVHGLVGYQPLGHSLEGMTTTEVYRGVVWDQPYAIRRSLGGQYQLIHGNTTRTLATGGPMNHVYGVRTNRLGLDAFLATDAACPDRYVVLIGSSGGFYTHVLGCAGPLQFQVGAHDQVYATETQPPPGAEPLAYEIGPNAVTAARPVSQLPDHPQYLANQRGPARAALVLRPAPQRTAVPEAASRLPPPEEIRLPDELPDYGPVTRPPVDRGAGS